MPKKATGSNARDAECRSKKDCVCGAHSRGAKNAKPKKKDHRRRSP